MALSPGTRLGPYEILSPLGAGGMGEVYRAKHLKLGRDVAIKVLPDELASDRKRLERFEREARAASSLNHPNTVTIHDIDEQDGVHYIAMELVAGRTLRDRLGEGSLPMGELVEIARQIATGLAKAHAAGIVHRDLKPGNIMITEDGLVKILDFGLAKLAANAEAPSELPTAQEVTRAGEILGTAPYMSPEQATGRPVDFRSDQFSFGSILYEMATGRRAFEKDSSPQTLAAIIEAEPTPVATLNDKVPAPVVGLIERCLSKDPRGRYDSTGDMAKELASSKVGFRMGRPPLWLAAAGLVVAAAAAVLFFRDAQNAGEPEPQATPMVAIPLTAYPGREAEPTLSPDGSQVAFSWGGDEEQNRDIYVQAIGSTSPLRLTSHPAVDGSPAWSPDGRRIAFLRSQERGGSAVLVVPPTGGPERRVGELGGSPSSGLDWSPDSRSLVVADQAAADGPLGLFLLDTHTGEKEALVAPPAGDGGYGYVQPAFSPDGQTVAFKGWHGELAVVPATGGEPREVASVHWQDRITWAPDGKDIIFDAVSSRPDEGEPRPSDTYAGTPILWRARGTGGNVRQLPGPLNVRGVVASRLGERLVFAQGSSQDAIWRIDLISTEVSSSGQIRFVASTRTDGNAQISPDGERVVFASNRSGPMELWLANEQGGELLQLTSMGDQGAVGSPRWSMDGTHIAFDFGERGSKRNWDIMVIPALGGAARRVTTDPASDYTPSWSRDGKSIYFSSNRSGVFQVWRVPAEGEREGNAQQVSRGGGFMPIESPDGQYVYFARRRTGQDNPRNSVWRIPVAGGEEEPIVESLQSSFCNWDLADGELYFVDRESPAPDAPWVVKLVDLATRRTTEVATLRHRPRLGGPAFSVSRDGTWVLSSQVQEESDLMLVENFR